MSVNPKKTDPHKRMTYLRYRKVLRGKIQWHRYDNLQGKDILLQVNLSARISACLYTLIYLRLSEPDDPFPGLHIALKAEEGALLLPCPISRE